MFASGKLRKRASASRIHDGAIRNCCITFQTHADRTPKTRRSLGSLVFDSK
jgi:hypothetical protein